MRDSSPLCFPECALPKGQGERGSAARRRTTGLLCILFYFGFERPHVKHRENENKHAAFYFEIFKPGTTCFYACATAWNGNIPHVLWIMLNTFTKKFRLTCLVFSEKRFVSFTGIQTHALLCCTACVMQSNSDYRLQLCINCSSKRFWVILCSTHSK